MTITLKINGREQIVQVLPGQTLAELLRETLNLTGTKIGCNEDECGICTVLVDGDPILSCNYPAVRAQGKEVITIEGLATPAGKDEEVLLHPLQEAFVKYGAVQCGFCIPGQIMTAYALLLKKPDPTSEDIHDDFKDTLCRCAGYPTIERAIKAAAYAMRTGEPVPDPEIQISAEPLTVIGNLQIRPDAVGKVTGGTKFTDDHKFEGMLHATVKRALVPHGIVRKLDTSRAKAMAGVQAVLTAEDIPGQLTHGLVIHDWPSLIGVGERVRYGGDALAIVAADTRQIALEALEADRD